MDVKRVGVVGAGQMGAGIAQVAAQAGYEVILVDLKEDFVQKGLATIDKSLSKLVEKKVLSDADAKAARGRIKTSTRNQDLAPCDLVVEAIVENPMLNGEVIRLDGALRMPPR